MHDSPDTVALRSPRSLEDLLLYRIWRASHASNGMVTRMVEGRIDRADSMDREDLAWTWLTNQFDKMPLFRNVALEVDGEYYVRVRAHSTPRNMSFVWPWQADDVVGLAKFTFMR